MRWFVREVRPRAGASHHTRALLVGAHGKPQDVSGVVRGRRHQLFTPRSGRARCATAGGGVRQPPALLYVGRNSSGEGSCGARAAARPAARGGHRTPFLDRRTGSDERRPQRQLPDAVFTGVLSRAAVARRLRPPMHSCSPAAPIPRGNVVLEAQASGLPGSSA